MLKIFIVVSLLLQLVGGFGPGAWAAGSPDVNNIRNLRNVALESCARGDVESGLNSFDDAIRMAQRAYGADSKSVAEICFEAGVLALQADRYQKAEECLTQAVKIDPNAVEARLKLAEYYKVRGRLGEAKQQLNRVLSKHPDCAEARCLLALTYEQEGNAANATGECFRLHELSKGKIPPRPTLALSPPPPLPAAVVNPLEPAVKPATAVLPKDPLQEQKARFEEMRKKLESKVKREAQEKRQAQTKREAQSKREAQAKREAKAKNKKTKGQAAGKTVAADANGPESSWGLPARLRSKAVLLTPIGKNGAKSAAASTAKGAKSAKMEPQVDPNDTRSPEAAEPDASTEAPPPPKSSAAPVKPVPKAKPASKPRAGLVPPPPPVVPVFPGAPMPVLQAPPPKPKPPEKAKPALVVPQEDKHGAEDDSDFLLDWAGKNKKKGK